MLPILSYYRNCVARAWGEFWRYFDLHTLKAWLNVLIPVFVGFLLTWQTRGISSVASDVEVWLISGLGTALIWGLIVFVAHLVVAPVQIDREHRASVGTLNQEKKTLEDRLRPKLEITYREEPPYQEFMPIWDNNGTVLDGTQKWIRVGVQNLSPVESIEGISIELERIEPNVIHHLPIPLQQMHGKDSLTLNPDETRHADVISIFQNAKDSPYSDHFAIHHAVSGISNVIPVTHYRITIVARGRHVPSVRKDFEFGIDTSYRYFFRPT